MRDWENIFNALSQPFAVEELKSLSQEMGNYKGDDKPYAPIDTYRNRLREVLGQDGYRVEYSGLEIVQVVQTDKNGNAEPKSVIKVDCRLTLLEDNGHMHAFTTSPGMQVIQGSGDANVAGAKRRACADAFKACCYTFQIGGNNVTEVWEEANQKKSSRQTGSTRQTGSSTRQTGSSKSSSQEPFSVVPAGEVKQGRNGSFYIPVTVGPDSYELWFYTEQAEQLKSTPSRNNMANRFEDITNLWVRTSQPLSVIAQRASGGGNKIYFRGEN